MEIRLVVASILFFAGLCIMLGPIPRKLKGSIYDSARKTMGLAMIVLPIVAFIVYFSPLRYTESYYTSVINLTGCYIMLILVARTFIPLLGRKVNENSPSFIWNTVSCFLYPMPMCGVTLLGGSAPQIEMTITISAIMLLVAIVTHVVQFFKLYKQAIKLTNNYYSDDVKVKIQWIINSVYLVISIGIIGSIGISFHNIPIWVQLIFTLYRLWVFLYIFMSFLKFIMTFEDMSSDIDVEIVPTIEEDTTSKLNPEARQFINKQLTEWIEKRQYTEKGITIQSVSTQIYTNRTYLSLYINTTYNCSFKTWISRLRIKEAKRLLYIDMNSKVETISDKVGFASPTTFITVFKQSEGVPPVKWKLEQGYTPKVS